MSVQNKMAPVSSILLQDLALIFSRMLENIITGSLGQVNYSEIFQIASKMLPCYEKFFSKNFLHLLLER